MTTPSADRPTLVLASGSAYRATVLRGAGYPIVVDPPQVDERALDPMFESDPEALAVELARRKAADVAPRHPDSLVLAADQVGVLVQGDRPRQLTKAPTESAAVDQLVAMSGSTHQLVNGVVVTRTDATGGVERLVSGVDVQQVTMRRFTREEALNYVRRFEPFDTAGSYRLEDQELMEASERFVTAVRGEHDSGVLGLPLPLLSRLLDELGPS